MLKNLRIRGDGLGWKYAPDGGAGGGSEDPRKSREHLTLARATKKRRGEIRAEIKAGAMAHCFINEPALKNIYVRDLLGWVPRYGNMRIQRVMAAMGAFNPTCSQLTEDQIAIMSYYLTWPTGKPFVPHPRARNRPS